MTAKKKHKKDEKLRVGLAAVIIIVASSFFIYVLASLRGGIFRPAVVSVPFIPGISFRIYTILVILGLLAACSLFVYLRRKLDVLNKLDIWDAVIFMLVPGIIGARLYYVLTTRGLADNVMEFLTNIIRLSDGGLSIIGGIPAGILGMYLYSKWKSLDLKMILNLAAISLVLAQIIGRFGNYFNRELFGYPTDMPWGMYIEPIFRGVFPDAEYFHPLFLYEILGNILLLTIMLSLFFYLFRKNKQELQVQINSLLFVKIYVAGYGLIRFVCDFYRVDSSIHYYGLTVTQVIFIALIVGVFILGLGYQVWFRVNRGKWFTDHKEAYYE